MRNLMQEGYQIQFNFNLLLLFKSYFKKEIRITLRQNAPLTNKYMVQINLCYNTAKTYNFDLAYTYMDRRSQKSIGQVKFKQAQRAYGCPCGKTYLSYPALFTHVKQKHDGKAPGKLIKPKTGKIRGRPKTRVNPEDLQLIQIINRIEHDVPQLIDDYFIPYQSDFQRSEGTVTCQDAATSFLDHFENLSDSGITVLCCFLNEIKDVVDSKYGNQYWTNQKPYDMIQVANDMYVQHQQKQDTFPISKQILKELIFNFFEWLYANKYTDHRLLKKTQEDEGTKDE